MIVGGGGSGELPKGCKWCDRDAFRPHTPLAPGKFDTKIVAFCLLARLAQRNTISKFSFFLDEAAANSIVALSPSENFKRTPLRLSSYKQTNKK